MVRTEMAHKSTQGLDAQALLITWTLSMDPYQLSVGDRECVALRLSMECPVDIR